MAAFANLDASSMLGRFQNSHREPLQSAPAASRPAVAVSTSGDPNDTIAGAERFKLDFTELGHLKYAMDIDIHRFPPGRPASTSTSTPSPARRSTP